MTKKFGNSRKNHEQAEEENACMKVMDLAVDGYDMIALGLEGVEIGRALAGILGAVVDERVPNRREGMMIFAEEYVEGGKG